MVAEVGVEVYEPMVTTSWLQAPVVEGADRDGQRAQGDHDQPGVGRPEGGLAVDGADVAGLVLQDVQLAAGDRAGRGAGAGLGLLERGADAQLARRDVLTGEV